MYVKKSDSYERPMWGFFPYEADMALSIARRYRAGMWLNNMKHCVSDGQQVVAFSGNSIR